jgi:autotransporter passenger strand-loop-strand repeat protein
VNYCGSETVYGGDTTSFTMVSSGGFEYMSSDGTAIGTVVSSGGRIDLPFLAYVSSGSANVNTSSLLTVSMGSQTYTQQLSGDYADESFQLSPDTYSGTLVTEEIVPCYCRGTRILTDRGEAAVEDLHIGDLIRTISGRTRPVEWIGRRKLECRRHAAPERVKPIRIAPHAFGENRPRRALLLSPDHSVFIEDVLIPIKFLVNGATVIQIDVATVTCYHLELARQDVVLAEGLPAETYLATGGRSAFENGGGAIQVHPDFGADEARVAMI